MARLAECVPPRLLFAFFLNVLDLVLHSKLKTPRRFISFIGYLCETFAPFKDNNVVITTPMCRLVKAAN